MQASNIAHFDGHARFHAREDRGGYDTDSDSDARDAAADPAEPLYRAQGLVGDALNLAGLLLASLEDQGDTRAMQIESAVSVIEEKLAEAFRQLGEYEMRAMRPRLEPDA
jgi:hypothetical protein